MRSKNLAAFICSLATISILTGCGYHIASRKSHHIVAKFVYWPIWFNDYAYDASPSLPLAHVGQKIGVIKGYPASEAHTYDIILYARRLPVGTELFKVPGKPTESEIAVEVSAGHYVAALREGKYTAVSEDGIVATY